MRKDLSLPEPVARAGTKVISPRQGSGMASGNDIKSATATYGSFISMFKFGTIAVVIIAAIVVLLIAS